MKNVMLDGGSLSGGRTPFAASFAPALHEKNKESTFNEESGTGNVNGSQESELEQEMQSLLCAGVTQNPPGWILLTRNGKYHLN